MKKFLKNIVKFKKNINNKRFPVRDISVNFRFGLHFLPTTEIEEEEINTTLKRVLILHEGVNDLSKSAK